MSSPPAQTDNTCNNPVAATPAHAPPRHARARASNRRLAKDSRGDTHSRAGPNCGPLAAAMQAYAVVTELAKR
eukprot:13799253-Alexandrium_andersonii.AAC.1